MVDLRLYPKRLNPKARCPGCGSRADAAGTSGQVRKPHGGDLSVCAFCGHLSIYNADLTLRDCVPADLEGADAELLQEIVAFQLAALWRGPLQ